MSIAIGATALVMLLVLAGGGVWSKVNGQDLHGAFLPKYIEAGRALFAEGRLPLWNPWESCGTPLFAVIQGLVLYLPAPLLFHLLPQYWALQALYAFNVLVLAWGTTAYLRAHGIGPWPAVVAVLVTVNGVFTSYSYVGYDHPNFLGSVAWLPWILLAWERAIERGPRPWLGLTALGVAALWLAGYPDFPLDFSVLLGVMALVSGGAPLARRVAYAGGAYLLGTALVAVQLVPLAEAVGESFRAQAMDAYASPRQLFALFSSGLFRPYVLDRFGVAALLLALLALWRPTRTRLAWWAALVVTVCAGDPPLSWIYALPPFSSVRFALGWSHIAALFVGLLVAAALQRGLAWRGAARVVVLLLAGVAAGGSAWSILRAPSVLRPVSPDYALLEERVPLLLQAQERTPGRPRVISGPELDSGMTVRARLASASGYDPTMPPRRVKRLIDAVNQEPKDIVRGMVLERNPRLARLLGVGLVVVPRHFEPELVKHGFRPVEPLPSNHVLLYQQPVARARIVHEATVASDEETSFARTVDPERDLAASAVIETDEPLPALAPPPADGATESATIVVDEPERVEVEARLASPGLLVLTDTWYPGWSATVDGVATPILRADYAFRAVALPAGEHRVTFVYAPSSLRQGAWITLGALLVLAALLVPSRRRTET